MECLKVCNGEEVNPVIPGFILVILSDVTSSFITNGDGSEISAAQINAPSRDYANYAKSAIVQGKLHIFGGSNNKNIVRLDSCTLVLLPYRLNFDAYDGHAALSISDNSEALICFHAVDWKYCEVFTGSSVVPSYSTRYSHNKGGLGFYNGRPITVGSGLSDGYRKVETLASTGWGDLADSPMNYNAHALIGLGNDLLMIGGYDNDHSFQRSDIWRLSDNSWSQEAPLKQSVAWGAAIAIENSIFIVGGHDQTSGSYSQRIDIQENDVIAGVQQIGALPGAYIWPLLFSTSQNYCSSD